MIQDAGAPPVWDSQNEAKQSVVEQALLQAFNPYSGLEESDHSLPQPRVISYTVQQGDTLSEIAYRYGITLKQLVDENKIANPHLVGIGMKLVIRRNELPHTVLRGETLESIASRYRVNKQAIIERNPLLRVLPDNLYVGQVLYIPMPTSQPALAGGLSVRRQMAQAASRTATRSRLMDWPVADATVTSGFGVRWGKMHKGIDLWNQSESKAPILAAREGVVVEAGANHEGYGYMVVLDHGDGLRTYYAHMRRILVYVGQKVRRGDVLGYMGNTGDSTGYHLHFEVRQDGVPVNPLRYLRQ